MRILFGSRLTQKLATLLSLTYFALLGATTVGASEHAGEHRHTANHAAQHASFICTWMCAAATHIPASDQRLHLVSSPTTERLVLLSDLIPGLFSPLLGQTRAPPFLL